jgi:hypothetical protein
MPLSEHEQRLLEEMERSLYHNDADFVGSVGPRRSKPSYRSIALGILIAIVGVIGLIVGVLIQIPIVGILGFVVMFGGVLLAVAPPRRSTVEQEAESAAHAAHDEPRQTQSGFMDKLNERWDKRQDGGGES